MTDKSTSMWKLLCAAPVWQPLPKAVVCTKRGGVGFFQKVSTLMHLAVSPDRQFQRYAVLGNLINSKNTLAFHWEI